MVDGQFLMEIMETREIIDNTNDVDQLKVLSETNTNEMKDAYAELQTAFQENNIQRVKELIASLQYWKRIEDTIQDKI